MFSLNQDIELTEELSFTYKTINLAISEIDWCELNNSDIKLLRSWAKSLRRAAGIEFDLKSNWVLIKDFVFEVMLEVSKLLGAPITCWMQAYFTLMPSKIYTAVVGSEQGIFNGRVVTPCFKLLEVHGLEGVALYKKKAPLLPISQKIKKLNLQPYSYVSFYAERSDHGHFIKVEILEVAPNTSFPLAVESAKTCIMDLIR